MLRLNSFSELNEIENTVNLAIGFFDGVHVGHQAVIRNIICSDESPAVVLTFDPHPLSILSPSQSPPIITPSEHKQNLIEKLGADYLLVINFDESRANQSAEEFVGEIVDSCTLKSISVGNEFRFGYERKGDVNLLTELGKSLGFKVNGIDRVCDESGDVISSTRVRESLKRGDLKDANSLLGREFSISGQVIKGDGIGRRMSFPTANIDIFEPVAIPNGVYAVLANLEGESFQGVANLGVRPTVMGSNNSDQKLEVYLFNFDRMIYGENLEVSFVNYIREEKKFNSVDDLKDQIINDVKEAKKFFH
ncbi:MAG: bifunctional riboflavin kinase/FAD synthetase [Verrucomicrobiales bacterium]|nr:bifunctional riboflavin kinase/FAD synthetase [Verrucomicrobiales bacterium]